MSWLLRTFAKTLIGWWFKRQQNNAFHTGPLFSLNSQYVPTNDRIGLRYIVAMILLPREARQFLYRHG